MKRTMKHTWLVILGLNCALAQAADDPFKELLKALQKASGSNTAMAPQPPTQPVAPQAPTAPTPPGVPPVAAPAEKPGNQLLKALLAGKTSEEDEGRIGQQIAGNLLGASALVKDEMLQRYVNRVGRWVALQSERPDLAWRFGVIDSDDLNAFAAPGGYIFVTKGLYRKLDNEAELAGVLGHEIGHVVRKHHLKLLQKSQAAAAIGALFGKQVKDGPAFMQNLIGNGAEMVARGLDKDAEFESDRLGMIYAARAGYDVYGLPTVLAEIGHTAKSDPRVSLLFKTHPAPDERLNRLSDASGNRLDGLAEGRNNEGRFYRLR